MTISNDKDHHHHTRCIIASLQVFFTKLRRCHHHHIFVCADTESKLRRCKSRASGDEDLSDKELLHRMKDIDKTRKRTREIICESEWGDPKAYHLTVNTSGREIKQLAPMVADYALKWFEGAK